MQATMLWKWTGELWCERREEGGGGGGGGERFRTPHPALVLRFLAAYIDLTLFIVAA